MTATVFGELGILGMLTLVSALQGLVLAGYLAWRHWEVTATRWLVLLISLMSLHLFDMTLSKTHLVGSFIALADVSFALIFLIGPLYYAYIRSLLSPGERFQAIYLLHALPALYIFVDMLPWLMTPGPDKLAMKLQAINMTENPPLPLSVYLKLGFNIMQNLAYLGLSVKLIREARQRFAAVSADGDMAESLKTLLLVTRGFALWVALYLVIFTALAFWGTYGAQIDHIWLFINALFLQAVGFGALARPSLFASVVSAAAARPEAARKYDKSALSADECADLRARFERLMQTEQPYLDGALRMPDVARSLSTSSHHLSQMLNQDMGASFLAVINRYRIEEVQRLMRNESGARDTVLSLAFQAGFNNKNSFNRCFREATGQTPSAYRKSLQAGG